MFASIKVLWFYRLSYVDYMMMEIGKDINGSINLMYDIGCKLAAHWKVYMHGY